MQAAVEAKMAELNLNNIFDFSTDILSARNRDTYNKYMEEFVNKYYPSFQNLAESADEQADKNLYIDTVAHAFANIELKNMEGLKRYKADERRMNTRMYMVMFVLPKLAEQPNQNGKLIADKIVSIWPDLLGGPKTFGYTTSENIGDRFGGDWISRLSKVFNGGHSKK